MSESTWNDPRITAYVLGEMTPEGRKLFERELKQDDQLAAAVEDARNITGQLADLFAAEQTPTLEGDRREQILAAGPAATVTANDVGSKPEDKSEQAVQPAGSTRHWKIAGLLVAIAATILLLVGITPPMLDNPELALREVREMEQEERRDAGADGLGSMAEQPDQKQLQNRLTPRQLAEQPATEVELPPSAEEQNVALGFKPSDMDGEVATDGLARLPEMKARTNSAGPVATAPASGRQAGKKQQSIQKEGAVPMLSKTPLATLPDAGRGQNGTNFFFGEQQNDTPADHPYGVGNGIALEEAENHEVGTQTPFEGYGGMAGEGEAFQRTASESLLRSSLDRRAGGYDPQPGRPLVRGEAGRRIDFGLPVEQGRGPGIAGDQFDPITENQFQRVAEHPLSTFSIDVDTASYSKVRDTLLRAGRLPRPDAVRIEELVNYFDYDYEPPADDAEHPFAVRAEVSDCPWNEDHQLARIALKGKELAPSERPRCNLVFLIDTSGSMNAWNKLPLVQSGMKMLLERLDDDDRVAIVVYAGSAGQVLDSTKADKKRKIRRALTRLAAGGSTNGGAGISLAYQTARDNFIEDGVNRVILCTDGDFNVGTTSTDALVRTVEQEAKGGVFLTVLGFGMGNHNDSMLEQISGRGNGNYAFIDGENEAHKVLVEQTDSTLVTIAKDVKLQIEFNPAKISNYRLIGYENRMLAKEDFNDDTKDAGEIGAGHSVTALYELVPAGAEADAIPPQVDPLKYQKAPQTTEAATSDELMTVALRYKQPDGNTSTRFAVAVDDQVVTFEQASQSMRFATAVAGFGMQLRQSQYRGDWTLSHVLDAAKQAIDDDPYGLRSEFLAMVRKTQKLMGEQ